MNTNTRDNSNESNESNESNRTSMENTLIDLYNEFNNNLNVNTVDFNYNYYDFFYIYNIYINMYSDEGGMYNTILQIFDEYNTLLTESINLQINVENISPRVILERNRIIFTVLEKNSHEYTDDDCCSICLFPYNDLEQQESQEEIIKTNCNHIFHLQCLSTWVNQNKKTCPVCRNAME
jgi:hypothetical protein